MQQDSGKQGPKIIRADVAEPGWVPELEAFAIPRGLKDEAPAIAAVIAGDEEALRAVLEALPGQDLEAIKDRAIDVNVRLILDEQ